MRSTNSVSCHFDKESQREVVEELIELIEEEKIINKTLLSNDLRANRKRKNKGGPISFGIGSGIHRKLPQFQNANPTIKTA